MYMLGLFMLCYDSCLVRVRTRHTLRVTFASPNPLGVQDLITATTFSTLSTFAVREPSGVAIPHSCRADSQACELKSGSVSVDP